MLLLQSSRLCKAENRRFADSSLLWSWASSSRTTADRAESIDLALCLIPPSPVRYYSRFLHFLGSQAPCVSSHTSIPSGGTAGWMGGHEGFRAQK